MEDEIIDIFDDNYKHIGTCSKKEAHEKGYWHRVFTCIVINPLTKSIILQKVTLMSDPSKVYLDISVGGHYQAGEKLSDGVREIKEELGLKEIKFKDLIPLGVRQTAATIVPNYHAREFQHIFLLPIKKNLQSYTLKSREHSGLIEVPIDEGINLLLGKKKKILVKGMSLIKGRKKEIGIEIKKENLVPYVDNLLLKLFILAKRYLRGEPKEYLIV